MSLPPNPHPVEVFRCAPHCRGGAAGRPGGFVDILTRRGVPVGRRHGRRISGAGLVGSSVPAAGTRGGLPDRPQTHRRDRNDLTGALPLPYPNRMVERLSNRLAGWMGGASVNPEPTRSQDRVPRKTSFASFSRYPAGLVY